MKYLKQLLALISRRQRMTGPQQIQAVLDGFSKMILELRLGSQACAERQAIIEEQLNTLTEEQENLDESIYQAETVIGNLIKLLGD